MCLVSVSLAFSLHLGEKLREGIFIALRMSFHTRSRFENKQKSVRCAPWHRLVGEETVEDAKQLKNIFILNQHNLNLKGDCNEDHQNYYNLSDSK